MSVINKSVTFKLYNYPAVKKQAKELNWTLSKLINFSVMTFMYNFNEDDEAYSEEDFFDEDF